PERNRIRPNPYRDADIDFLQRVSADDASVDDSRLLLETDDKRRARLGRGLACRAGGHEDEPRKHRRDKEPEFPWMHLLPSVLSWPAEPLSAVPPPTTPRWTTRSVQREALFLRSSRRLRGRFVSPLRLVAWPAEASQKALGRQGVGARDHLENLLGDLGLAGSVHAESEAVDQLLRVLRGVAHRGH